LYAARHSPRVRPNSSLKENLLAKPNYQFEKRQKEIAKKKKKEEKLLRKAEGRGNDDAAEAADEPTESPAPAAE